VGVWVDGGGVEGVWKAIFNLLHNGKNVVILLHCRNPDENYDIDVYSGSQFAYWFFFIFTVLILGIRSPDCTITNLHIFLFLSYSFLLMSVLL
jgi:hypothetical protein